MDEMTEAELQEVWLAGAGWLGAWLRQDSIGTELIHKDVGCSKLILGLALVAVGGLAEDVVDDIDPEAEPDKFTEAVLGLLRQRVDFFLRSIASES